MPDAPLGNIMKYPSLATALWCSVTAGAFALGWWMKPPPPDHKQSGTVGGAQSMAGSLWLGGRSVPPGIGHGRTGASGRSAIPAGPLTVGQIDEWGLEFRRATDPILKREAFAKLLAGLTAENAMEVRRQIEHFGIHEDFYVKHPQPRLVVLVESGKAGGALD